MATWKEHFDAWHKLTKADLSPVGEEGRVLAGREAEDLLRRIVNENYSFKGCHSFASKRVPDPHHGRRREIDLIVVTAKRLYVIECKNWSGALTAEGERWVQRVHTGRGVVDKPHEDILALNTWKMQLIVEYLRGCGVPVDMKDVSQKVIFMNPKLRILSPGIMNHPDVITPDRLEAYLSAESNKLKTHERFLSSVIGLLLDHETKGKFLDGLSIRRVGADGHERMIRALRELPTWDKVFLRGTKLLSGDVVPGPRNIFKDRRGIPFGRVKEARVVFPASKWASLAKAVLKIGRPVGLDLYDPHGRRLTEAEADPSGVVRIREAGSPHDTDVEVWRIERIRYGKFVPAEESGLLRGYARPLAYAAAALALVSVLAVLFSYRDAIGDAVAGRGAAPRAGLSARPQPGAALAGAYVGDYGDGRRRVTVYMSGGRLHMAFGGKAWELLPSSETEFSLAGAEGTPAAKVTFGRNAAGAADHLLWVGSDGKSRKYARRR